MAYDAETRAEARELYCSGGLSYDEVADRTGISVRTLKYWGVKERWRNKRDAINEDLATIHADTIALRKTLIRKVLRSLEGDDAEVDPQKIYAVSALEGATAKLSRQQPEDDFVDLSRPINGPEEAIEALEEAVRIQINRFLSQPGTINLAGIRDFKKALELIEDMKSRMVKGDSAEDKAAGLTDEGWAALRMRILKGDS